MKIRVKLNSEKKTLKNVDLETGTGQATVIKHPANGTYTFQLVDLATNLGPQKIIAKRVGNNLEISFEDSKTTDLIIENYYREGLEESPIIGLAEDGQYYAYIPENGLASDAIPVLKENVLATEVLGGEGFVAAAIPFVLGWPWVAGGLGLLGAVAALAGGGSGGGSGGSSVANIRLTEGTTAENNRGGFKLDWPAGAEKVEVTFYPEGSHKPLTVTLTKDADGNIISSHPNFIPGVGKDQPIIIPPNSLKDNSPVDVKAFNGNGNVIAQGSGTSAYDADSAPAKVKEAIEQDTDGDGNPNRVKLDLTGPADAPFKVVDKDGKVIAEGTFDKNGEASILAPLDPKNPNRDSKDDLKVITQENGTNRTETALAPAEMVPAPELKPSANPTDPEKSFEVDVKLDNKENTKEIKLDVVDPATGKVTNTITLTKDEKGEFKGPEGVKVENTEEGVKVTLPKDKVPEGSQITASTTNNAGDTSAPSNPVENKQGEEGLVPVKPETLQPSAKPIIESIKAVDSSSPADNNPDEFIVSGTGPANSSITIYGQKGNDKYPIGSTTTDENGKFTVTVTDQDKGVDLVSGDNISVVAHETGKQPTSSDNEPIPEVADRTPNNTFVPAPELKPSENPTDPENSFEVDVKLDDKENTKEIKLDVVDPATGNVTNTITLTKDEKGEFKGPEGVKVENTEDGVKVTLPKDKVPEKSQITASTTNNAGETSAPSNPVENKGGEEGLKPVDPQTLPPSDKPTIDSIKAIDTSSPADNNPEEFIVSGTGPKNTSITIYGHKGDEKFPIGSATTDENGNFTATVTDQGKGVDLVSGDKISAAAHETGKQPTPSDEAKEIPAVPAGKEGHTVDTVKPEAKVEIVTHNEPGSEDGSAVVNTSGMRPGDKLVIGITTEEGEDKTLEFTMGDNGTLQPSPNNDPALNDKVKVEGGKVTIDESALKDNESVIAKVVDIADNETVAEPKKAGYDEASAKPTVESIKTIDTDSPANTTPEKIEAKVTGVTEGDTVIFRDENGDKIDEVKVTPEMKQEDGSYIVPATLKDDQKDTKKVTVTVKSGDKGESAPVTVDVPPVPNGKEGHPNDSVEPKSPEVSATEDKVNVKFDPENTDTLTIKVQPKDEKGQDKGQPTEIVYEKQPDGSFKPTDPKFPTIPKGKDTVEIPRDKLPTDDLDVTASAGDIAGNSSTSQTTPVEDAKEKSATPTVESVKAIDTNEVADKTYERTEIKGTGVQGAEVIATVTDKDGNVVEIGRATVGEDGKFTIRGDVPAGFDITDTKNIKVTAEEPNKRISDPVNKDQIPTAEITHPNDLEAPLKPITLPLLPEDNAKVSDQKVQLPPDTETATVEYIDNEGNPKTANITKDAEGNFVSDDPAVSVGKDNIIFIKGDATKDNTPVKVTATDLAGNKGEPLVISSGSDVPVIDENQPNQPNVPSQPTVTEQPAAGDNPAGKKDIVVKFPTDANVGDKVNVTYTPAPTPENPNPKPVVETFTKTPDGWKKPDGSTLPDVTNDNQGNPELVIPGDKVKDGTSVIVNAQNAEGTGRTEDAILDKTTPDGDGEELPPVEKLATPTELKLEAVDNRQGGDRTEANPDSFTLTGKVPNAPEGTEVIIKNGDEVVGKGTTDKDGNFSIDFTDEGKKEDITKDTKLSVTAQKPGQPETASETPADITVKPEDIVRADQTPPTVDITPTENGATVTPDKTNPLNEGDKVTITVTPPATPDNPNPNPTTHTYTADANGQLQPNDPASPPVKNDGSIDVPAVPGSTVAVTTEDTAGNSTGKTDGENGAGENPNSVVVPPKAVVPTEKTATPEDVTVKTVEDSNNPADGNPDKFTVTGKVPGATVGTDVEVLDKAGNVLGKGKTTDAEGNFEILASESPNKDLAKDDALVVKATDTAAKKAPSEPAEAQIGDVNKYADTQAPETPDLTASPTDGSVVLTLPKDANPTDTVVVELTPTGAKDPVKVTLEKNPDGSWTSSHPDLVPNAIDDQESVTIPEGVIADGSKVKAHATDKAGNNSDAKAFDEVTVGEDTRTTKAPEVTIDAVDTDNKADKQADVAIVKGKTDPNAEVTIKDGDKELGTVTADAEGNFTAIIAKPNAANLDGDKGVKAQNPGAEVINSPNGVDAKELTFSAVAPNKKPSAEIPATVPAIEAKPEDHPYDESNPVAPTLEAVATGDKSGSVNVNFPANNDSVPGDKVTINFTPEDKPAAAEGEQPTPAEAVSVTYEKQDDGSWKPVAEDAEKAKENKLPESVKADDDTTKPSLTIPADSLKDGSDVTALATDNAGKTAKGQAVNAQGQPLKEDGTPVADGEKPAEKVVAPEDKTATPVVTKVEGLNTQFEPDTTAPSAVRITGTVENGVTKDKIKVYGSDGQEIPANKLAITVTPVEKDGVTTTNFEIIVDKIADVKDKGPLQITAQAGEKPESERSAPQPVPTTVERGKPTDEALAADAAAKATDKGGFINDDTPPAKPTLTKGTGDADGEMSIELPADAKIGTRLIASYTDEKTGEAKTIYVEKGEKAWSAVDAKGKAATLPENVEIKANENKLVIGEDAVKDKSEVKARFQDLAGNLSENNKETTNFDEQTAQPTLTVQSIDTAEKADNTIDAILLSGTVTNEAGAKVTFFTTAKDAAQGTDPTALANVSATVGTDGNYKVVLVKTGTSAEDKGKLKTKLGLTDDAQIVEVAELPEVGTKFTAKAQQHNAEGQPTEVLSAASTEAPLAALGNNTESHPFDKTPPAAATIEAPNDVAKAEDKGDAIITLPTAENSVAGDTLTINYIPQTNPATTAPVDVVYTFNGTEWKPTSDGDATITDHPTGFSIVDGKLRIDAPNIKDGSTITTKVTDNAGKNSGEPSTANQTEATVGTDPKFTPAPTDVTHYTVDTDTDANASAEQWLISGKAPKGSTVYLKNKDGVVIAKHTVTDGTDGEDEANFGTFSFTVTKGDTASATGDAATANATVTDFAAIAGNNAFSVSAKKDGEAEGVYNEKLAPQDVAPGMYVNNIDGSGIDKDASLYNGTAPTDGVQYTAGNKTMTGDKSGAAANQKFIKPVEDYFLVANPEPSVPGAPQQDPRPFVDGNFTYTSARLNGDEKEIHTADTTAPNATITVLEAVSGNIAKRKVVTPGSAGVADTSTDATAEANKDFGFKVTTNKTVEGDTITVVRYKAGSGVNAGNADNNEKAVYKFENGAWKQVSDAENLSADDIDDNANVPASVATVGKGDDKPTTFTFTPDANKVKAGDLFVVTYKDYAGNAKQAMRTVKPEMLFDATPETADVPDVFVGTISRAGTKDATLTGSNNASIKPNEKKFLINGAGEGDNNNPINAVNSGDIVFRPGKDNVKVEIRYFDEAGAEQTIYGQLQPATGDVSNRATDVFKFYMNKDHTAPLADGIINQVVGEDGSYYYVLNAAKVKDATTVNVMGIDGEGNNSYEKPTLAEDGTKKETEVLAGFDDKTDSAVGKPTVEQADANTTSITITPTSAPDTDGNASNNADNDDTVAYVVTFDATHLDKETTARYGLNAKDLSATFANDANQDVPEEHGKAQGVNYIVVSRDAEGKWSATLVKGEGDADGGKADKLLADALSDALNGNSAANDTGIPADIGTLEPTGIFRLNKDFVKGGSSVAVKAIDAYGNQQAADAFTAKHQTAENTVITDQPVITDLGFGNAYVDFGGNNDKVTIASFFNDNTDVIEVTRNPRPEPKPSDNGEVDGAAIVGPAFSIKVGDGVTPATPENLAAKGIVFDEDTGRVTLKTPTDKNDIIVTGYREEKPSVAVVKVLDKATDPTPDSVDEIDNIEALQDGSVTFKPGADNTKVTVEYTKTGENKPTKVTLTKQADGSWSADNNEGDFDEASLKNPSGVIKLKAGAVKDMHNVTVWGTNKKGADALDALANEDITLANLKAELLKARKDKDDNKPETVEKLEKLEKISSLINSEKEALSGKDDATDDRAEAPTVPDINASPATKADLPTVAPGQDNNRVEIKFTPKADSPTEKTISAVLKQGGWDLVDDQGNPVNDDMASIDPATGVVTINTPLQGNTSVKAKGTDPYSNQSTETAKPVPQDGTAGNPENGGNTTSQPVAPQPNDPKPTGGYLSPTFSQPKGRDDVANLKKADNGSDQTVYFNIYDVNADKIKGMAVNLSNDTFAISDTPIRSNTVRPSGFTNFNSISQSGDFITKRGEGDFAIASNGKYRLLGDSPKDTDENSGALLSATDPLLSVASASAETGVVAPVGSQTGYAQNVKGYTAGKAKSEPFELAAPKDGADQGAVIISPKAGKEYTNPVILTVKYIDESGNPQTATLRQETKGGAWTVASGKSEHFDLTGTNPKILANALEDKHANGVSVRVLEKDKAYSSWTSATPWLDPVQPEPEVPESERPTTNGHFDNNEHSLNTSDARNSIAGDDILTRDWPNRDVRSDGLNEIAKNEKGLTVTTNNGKTVITAKDIGDKANTLLIDGSIGDTAPSVFKFPRQDIEINMGEGNDIVATKNHLGDYKGYNTLNLGEGNDLVTVGTGGDFFKLYEKKGETNPAKRFDFAETNKTVPNGTALNALEQGGYERGGSMVNTTINGGAGNDVVAVEGDVRADRAAIGHGVKIDLGDGHDAVIIAPNNANSKSQRGEISDGAVVDFGKGNDYLKAVGLRNGAKVNMGEGNDEVALDRILSGNTVLNTGKGNDTVSIGLSGFSGEARDGAQINLGEGNDTLRFKAKSNLWGKATDEEARFMAKLDGGAGYDTFVLETPDQINVGGVFKHNITHLSTKYIKNIEEVQMSRGSAFDISIGDLWKQAPGVLRINTLGPDSEPLRPTNQKGGAMNRIVDLGETNANTGTETYKPSAGTNGTFNGYDRVGGGPNDFWKKVDGVTHTEKATDVNGREHSVTYDVYRFGGDSRYEVWIEHGIQVI